MLKICKKIIRQLTPPMIWNLVKSEKSHHIGKNNVWAGNYSSWQEAEQHSTGYDKNLILEKCKNALLKVKNGEAVYERDSVIFDEIQYSWGLLAGLQKAAIENDNKLCVLDFGGSLGSSYYQNKDFLSGLSRLDWCIVEQSNFVECGKKYFEDEHLTFYYTIEECLEKNKPDVLLLGSVVSYLEKPYEWIEKFVSLKIPYIIFDRTALITGSDDLLTVQTVPSSIYEASYPCWFLSEEKLLGKFSCDYTLLACESDYLHLKAMINGNTPAEWKIIILKRK